MRALDFALPAFFALTAGCSGENVASEQHLVVSVDTWPEKLSETGLFAAGTRFTTRPELTPENAFVYVPNHPLWTNGSRKLRHLVLPDGTAIDNQNPYAWKVPEGTLAFKTLFFANPANDSEELPIETRVIRRQGAGVEYAVYLWDESGTDATLRDDETAVDVEVTTFEGATITHTVPSRFDCRTCHESSPRDLLGLDDLQLSGSATASGGELFERGWLSLPLTHSAAQLPDVGERTERALSYFIGNCTHCHNGSDAANSTYSLLPNDALAHLINQPTQGSGSAPGIRVSPGSPDESVLYQALLANDPDHDLGPEAARPMPPLGVQHLDRNGISVIKDWIESLEPEPTSSL
jgi:hypothetical protein